MKRLFKSSYFALIILLIYLPIGIMVIFSFNSGNTVSSWMGFSTKWYEQFFQDSTFIKSIITSLFVAVVSTAISLVIGVSAAIGLSKLDKRKRNKWLTISNVPLINADIITAVALMVVFLLCGIKFGIFTLIMAHISFNVPYVIITVMPRLRKIDQGIIEASNDLGAKSSTVIFKVILPILKPAIILAAFIAFAMSFDDFIISYFTGGDQQNVSGFIYAAKRIKPFIFAFGTLTVAIIALAVLVYNAFLIVGEKQEETIAQIKNGTYKQKEIYKLQSKLNLAKSNLENLSIIKKSYSIKLWVQYWILSLKLWRASLKNYDKKISVLEWKRYKLQTEINNEKKYKSKLLKNQKKELTLRKQKALAKDVKKAAKYSIDLEKIIEEIEFLTEEIEWMKARDDKAVIKAKSINDKLQSLISDFNQEVEPSKSTIKWYTKKIKYYKDWKIEVEEGKNNYKLKLVVEKLKEIKKNNENKISNLSSKKDLIWTQIYRQQPILVGYKDLKQTKKLSIIENYENKIKKTIDKIQFKITPIQMKIAKKSNEFYNIETEDVRYTKNWFTRSWKVLLVSLIGLASFSALTVAFIKNNIYDLTVGNWGEYIDRTIIKDFEKEYKVKVNYQEYDSNETLYNKLYTFSYDLMVPSDYMVQKLAEENKLEQLDYSKLNVWSEAFEYLDQSDAKKTHEGINKQPVDSKTETKEKTKPLQIVSSLLDVMGNSRVNLDSVDIPEHSLNTGTIADYALNYFWGDLTIVINPNSKGRDGGDNIKWLFDNYRDAVGVVDESGTLSALKVDDVYDATKTYGVINFELSWDILWKAADAGKKVVINEDPKNLFAIGGQKLFGKGNLKNKSEIDDIAEELKTLVYKPNVGLEGDSLIQTAGEGRFDFAVMYNGDAANANALYNGESEPEEDEVEEVDEESLIAEEITENEKVYFLYGRPNKYNQAKNFRETTNIYSDNMVMSKNAKNKDLAYKFMNFIIANAEELSNFTGTPTPYVETLQSATEQGATFEKYKNLFLPIVMKGQQLIEGNLEPFFYNGKIDDYLVDEYTNLIAGKQ
ncbi:spermidine/putrescine ABC transporter permease [Entomoplasma ellychniae]|uniref:Spermidine/putrescine ABC transporter permease n=1 Tax=Entomoplasma ellychniae TaxID=2114 RepID=A0A8E2UAC2_9MOLU|nr:spermidine/putrescine ABC transporter permease/substrate-binding protein [Entomoplasma ellychniae]PPE04381.1 spermidine/putrescine ABC transporter permease [Entomoplasma ellychniae]